MWWARRKFLTIAALLVSLLGGCEAVSVQSLRGLQNSQLAEVGFDVPDNRAEQLFIRSFQKASGQAAADPLWQLSFQLSYSASSRLSVRGTSSALTSSQMSVSYQLVNLATGKLETSGSLSAEASSGAVSSFYAQTASARHAEERLAELLGTRLAARLTSYFARNRTGGG